MTWVFVHEIQRDLPLSNGKSFQDIIIERKARSLRSLPFPASEAVRLLWINYSNSSLAISWSLGHFTFGKDPTATETATFEQAVPSSACT